MVGALFIDYEADISTRRCEAKQVRMGYGGPKIAVMIMPALLQLVGVFDEAVLEEVSIGRPRRRYGEAASTAEPEQDQEAKGRKRRRRGCS